MAALLRKENAALARVLDAVDADPAVAARARAFLAGAPVEDAPIAFAPLRVPKREPGGVRFNFADVARTAATAKTGGVATSGLFRGVDEDEDADAPAAPSTPAEPLPEPVRNDARHPNFVCVEGLLYKRGGGKSFFGRNTWKQRLFQLVLDATDENGVTIGPLFRYADPKRPAKILGRDLLDGAALDRHPERQKRRKALKPLLRDLLVRDPYNLPEELLPHVLTWVGYDLIHNFPGEYCYQTDELWPESDSESESDSGAIEPYPYGIN